MFIISCLLSLSSEHGICQQVVGYECIQICLAVINFSKWLSLAHTQASYSSNHCACTADIEWWYITSMSGVAESHIMQATAENELDCENLESNTSTALWVMNHANSGRATPGGNNSSAHMVTNSEGNMRIGLSSSLSQSQINAARGEL